MGKKATSPDLEEIDELFKGKKRKIPKVSKTKKDVAEKKKPVSRGKKQEAQLKVYTEEDLNIGKGGYTDKCPFDCDCCF